MHLRSVQAIAKTKPQSQLFENQENSIMPRQTVDFKKFYNAYAKKNPKEEVGN